MIEGQSRPIISWGAGALAAASAALLVSVGCQSETVPKATAVVAAAGPSPAKISFNEHIQPLLSENRYPCHGPDSGSRKASLRLDRKEAAFAPHEKMGPAIVPGKPDASALVQRIESKSEKDVMPPPEAHKTMKPEEIALLRRWVAEGAEYQDHWAFIAPQRPAVPAAYAPPAATPSTPSFAPAWPRKTWLRRRRRTAAR
jgi:hypothetical protein